MIDVELLHEFLFHSNDPSLDTELCIYPYHERSISTRICPPEYERPRSFLTKHDTGFLDAIDIYKNTSNSAPYSPRKVRDELLSYYVLTKTYNDLDDHLMPVKSGKWRYSSIVYTGPKGSGKTSMQNYWLGMNHDQLESKDILYLRCDAQLLYDSWMQIDDKIPQSDFPSIADFFQFQLLAILAEHRDVGGLPARIMKMLDNMNTTFKFKENRDPDKLISSPMRAFDYIDNHIADQIKSRPEYITSNLFRDKITKRREFFRWQRCSQATKEVLLSSNIKLLYILDGVDNLHLNTDHGVRLYTKLLPELITFTLRSGMPNELKVAVMRPRTWIDIQKSDPSTTGCTRVVEPLRIKHQVPDLKEVVRKRTEWIAMSESLQEKEEEDARSLAVKIIQASASALPSAEIMHNNIRNIIMNTATLAEQVRFRWHQLGKDSMFDHQKQAYQLMKRNLFLNGDFILETQETFDIKNRVKGVPFINPFWIDTSRFPQSRSKACLHFLRIRILEFLYRNNFQQSDLTRYLNNNFGYQSECVEQALKDARAFGWIDSREDETETKDVVFEISATGRYLLDELLTDADVLYMLAVDTLIPRDYIAKNVFHVHTNHLKRSDYIGSSSVTVITFLKYLCLKLNADQAIVDLKSLNHVYCQRFLSREFIIRVSSHISSKLMVSHEDDKQIFLSAYGNALTRNP